IQAIKGIENDQQRLIDYYNSTVVTKSVLQSISNMLEKIMLNLHHYPFILKEIYHNKKDAFDFLLSEIECYTDTDTTFCEVESNFDRNLTDEEGQFTSDEECSFTSAYQTDGEGSFTSAYRTDGEGSFTSAYPSVSRCSTTDSLSESSNSLNTSLNSFSFGNFGSGITNFSDNSSDISTLVDETSNSLTSDTLTKDLIIDESIEKNIKVFCKKKKDHQNSSKKKKNRPNFSEETVGILLEWLFEHKENPYPDLAQKQHLCEKAGIAMVSLNNWFVNARRRYIQNGNESKKIRRLKLSCLKL
ncbi:hypothetical protein HK099_002688, partial [Clydaea vesicula]